MEVSADDEVANTLLESPLVEKSRVRLAVPMEVARPTGPFLPRVVETAFGIVRASSCGDQMELGGLPTPQSL